jgi:subtilisin family serine protease
MGSQDNGLGISGVAPLVRVNSIRIFRRTYPPESQQGTVAASTSQMAAAINYAWNTLGSHVLSNSWGGGAPSTAITNAITNALSQGRGGLGAVVVFAAGNPSNREGGYIGPVQYPASLSSTRNVISVGAINRYGDPANYTPDGTWPWGPRIDVVAPSGHYTDPCVGEVVTLDRYGSPGCNDGPGSDINYTSTFSGTSATAPQVRRRQETTFTNCP